MRSPIWAPVLAGFCAGAVNGLFGAGGGMVLIPLLAALTDLEGQEPFTVSLTVMLPLCLVSLGYTAFSRGIDFSPALPYLLGGGIGGLLAGKFGKGIPTKWLHRSFGILLILGGGRYLC